MGDLWNSIAEWGKEHLSEWTMSKVYIACAIAGASVLIGQTGLNLFGLGGDTDVDPNVDVDALEGGDSLNFLSIRALAGFLTFFGLVGWGGTSSGWGTGATVAAASASGASVMFIIAWLMSFFRRMQSSGTIKPEAAVGLNARVYLRIPGHRSGKGKITVSMQGRTVEFEATTAGEELPTGSECRVVRMTTGGTFEVSALE